MSKECYLIRGLPGTGKTTISKILSEILNIEILSTDKIRRSISFNGNLYSKENKEQVYRKLEELLLESLNERNPKILDGTFSKVTQVERIYNLCKTQKYGLKIIECFCSEETIKKRLITRTDSLSDADYDVYEKIKEEYEVIGRNFQVYPLNTEQSFSKLKAILKEIIND